MLIALGAISDLHFVIVPTCYYASLTEPELLWNYFVSVQDMGHSNSAKNTLPFHRPSQHKDSLLCFALMFEHAECAVSAVQSSQDHPYSKIEYFMVNIYPL